MISDIFGILIFEIVLLDGSGWEVIQIESVGVAMSDHILDKVYLSLVERGHAVRRPSPTLLLAHKVLKWGQMSRLHLTIPFVVFHTGKIASVVLKVAPVYVKEVIFN